jgi:HK97 family phage prohead protease
MDTLRKTFLTEVKSGLPDSRSMKFIISTDSIDRDGDSVSAKGWDLSNYLKSPVVLWSHDYSTPPIAKATQVEQTANGLAATAEFPQKGVYPLADTVYELLKGGFLSATSVGFRPLEVEKATDREKGMNFSKQELLEFSIVPVPANPEALIQMSASSPEFKASLKPVDDWCEDWLSKRLGSRGVFVSAEQVEKTFDAITKMGLLTRTKNDMAGQSPSSSSSTDEETPEEDALEIAEEGCQMPKAADEPMVLEVTDEVIQVNPEHVRGVVDAAFKSMIEEVALTQVQRSLDYASGRVR